MGELVLFRKRQPIYVLVPQPNCEVLDCENVRKIDMVVYFPTQGRLDIYQVCAQHVFLLKGKVPALYFPLDQTPSLPWIAKLLEEEILKRQPPRVVYLTGWENTSTTFTGGNYFRF